MTHFAIIGFGEVGGIFARDLHQRGAVRISAYDSSAVAQARAADTDYVDGCETPQAAADGADVVFVSVTAASVLDAMASLGGGLQHRPYVIDVNSVSPATKRAASHIVGEAGGRYVEAAVMTSVPPHGLSAPMLLGGPHAGDWMEAMRPFAMRLEVFSADIGAASSVKMCRSVMIKGLEALATECLLAARHYGVDQQVLASLADTLPHPDWPQLARYLISRALLHGQRRAEEMREVARTVQDAGLVPLLSEAIAERQQWAAVQGRRLGPVTGATDDLGSLLDALAAASARPAIEAMRPSVRGGAGRARHRRRSEEQSL